MFYAPTDLFGLRDDLFRTASSRRGKPSPFLITYFRRVEAFNPFLINNSDTLAVINPFLINNSDVLVVMNPFLIRSSRWMEALKKDPCGL